MTCMWTPICRSSDRFVCARLARPKWLVILQFMFWIECCNLGVDDLRSVVFQKLKCNFIKVTDALIILGHRFGNRLWPMHHTFQFFHMKCLLQQCQSMVVVFDLRLVVAQNNARLAMILPATESEREWVTRIRQICKVNGTNIVRSDISHELKSRFIFMIRVVCPLVPACGI